MRRLYLWLLLLLIAPSALAQSGADSLLIVNADWSISSPHKGLTHKQAQIKGLYNSTQSINLIEIAPSPKRKVRVASNNKMVETSLQASEHKAVAAINGTYYNMKAGNSTCFYKINKKVIDNTTDGEFKTRVNGAIHERGGKITIIEWNKQIESEYQGKQGTVLASGPIMVDDGKISDWSSCSQSFIDTRHPRSAIFTKEDGTVVLLTVDGRSAGNADGMSIPELAFLAKVLGAEDAINLDGGGSTTLWMKGAAENGILNYPSDNKLFDHQGERKVSNIFYVK